MHESGIVQSLVAHAESVVDEAGVAAAERIGLRVGALAGVDPDVLRTHWRVLAHRTSRAAVLDIVIDDDPTAPDALGVSLVYIDVGD